MLHVSLRMARISFGALACTKKKIDDSCDSMLLKSRASPDMLPFSLCNKTRLAIRHMNRPLFPMTLSIRHLEVVRPKNLSAPPRKSMLQEVGLVSCPVRLAVYCLHKFQFSKVYTTSIFAY